MEHTQYFRITSDLFTKDRDELISVYNQTEYSNRYALKCKDSGHGVTRAGIKRG